ncbi:flagellar hook-basal body complex protein [Hyphococcus flavus]|uniref:Flagellar hook protein FlgE n=1 Tax=Hyphococcus flavus TaxID=1866326 RepID=A0AAF0CEM2_9PROT|nr:flagellar hook-basal body complex protein [Hyphococcus flavus]WDI31526.1 flagellar hook-basal body complex protein [Hyphococcus flavus]
MGISSSLNAGVMGLAVNSVKLGTISDNIANSQTYGYKRAESEFADMVLRQTSGDYSAGGVRAMTYRDAGAQGALVTTSNSTDISISGRGMLPVTDVGGVNSSANDRSLMLASTGSFFTDEQGYLKTLSGLYLMGWPADINGNVASPPRDSAIALEPVRVNLNQFAAAPTTQIQLGVNLPATETEAGAAGTSYNLPIEYFDTLGRSQTLQLDFTPTVPASGSSNEWTVEVYDEAGDPSVVIATFTVAFDDSVAGGGSLATVTPGAGAAYDATTGNLTFSTASSPVDMYIGRTGEPSALTQLSGSFAPLSVTKDGAPIGNLSSIEIDERGFLQAIYETGFRRTIYQIPVADVPNFKGLNAVGNSAFTVTQDSGDVYFWDAGDGPAGLTIGFALTESTTDIASELTDLIQTQRAYSSNAKIIQTVDEMLQETTDIIR